MKKFLRNLALAVIHRFGSQLVDQRTGRPIGRVLVLTWAGRIHIIGLPNLGDVPEQQVRWKSEPHTVFYRQSLEFASHPQPDFPNENRSQPHPLPPHRPGN
jgi:hypothetical protein